MFEDKRYKIAGPSGGPGVLGPWRAPAGAEKPHRRRAMKRGSASVWNRIRGRARTALSTSKAT